MNNDDKIILTFETIQYTNMLIFGNKKYIKDTDNPYIFISGNSISTIKDWTFYNYSSLTNIIIPDTVTSIGEYAFCHCTSLTSIVIPDTVTTIGGQAFYKCSSLTTIETNNENAYIIEYCKTNYPNIKVIVNDSSYVLK